MIAEKEIKKLFSEVNSLEEANSLRKRLFEEHIDSIRDSLINEQSQDKKKDLGKQLNFLIDVINRELEKIKSIHSKKLQEIEEEDLSIPNYKLLDYSFNPLEKVKEDLINFFSYLDFPIKSGSEIVDAYDNFEKLNFSKNHPSRSYLETFYVDNNRILRPHCTVNSVQFLFDKSLDEKKEFKIAVLGPVYRRDSEDSSHIHQFTQLDFLWVKSQITFSELESFLESVCTYLFGNESWRPRRIRNSYFPFTKPSIEIDVGCVCNKHPACNICKGTGWIEVLGAGMLNKKILENAGYSSEFECIAGGIGLERIALIRHGVWDIRWLYDNDFSFLRIRNGW